MTLTISVLDMLVFNDQRPMMSLCCSILLYSPLCLLEGLYLNTGFTLGLKFDVNLVSCVISVDFGSNSQAEIYNFILF